MTSTQEDPRLRYEGSAAQPEAPTSPVPVLAPRPGTDPRPVGGANASASAGSGSRLRSPRQLLTGPEGTPRWERPALLALLVATAVLYLWNLGASGWANAFYSAAAQAGSQSWKALFFASSDAANSITVDKPPVSLWFMGLSARIFGVNAWSILVPQALMGVAAVGVLYASVRRTFGPVAGLIAGVVLATTPVAALMFRFNNPDALLVLLLVIGAYATLRAQEKASTRWLVAAGTLVGFAFLTKMLQALLVVPAFGLVYLLAAPTNLWHRVRQLALALAALVASAGWYIALVELIPASARPYIGGSQNNSILELTLGYNGLGRLTGNEVGSVGGGGQAGGWGATGWLRMFNAENGGQVSWLLPAAMLLLLAGLWATRRAPRTDPGRAAFVLWGGWLLVTGLVFSQMQGIFHAYYDVALAPAIAALAGAGSVVLWRTAHAPASAGTGRSAVVARILLAVTVAGTAIWSYVLLDRTPDWNPWLRTLIVVVGVAAGLLLLVAHRMPRQIALAVAAAGLLATLLGPTAYAVATASTPHTGSIPSAGPSGVGGFGGPGGGGGGGGGGGPQMFLTGPGGTTTQVPGGGRAGGGTPPNGTMQLPGQGGATGTGGGMGAGGVGGLLGAGDPSEELVELLATDADAYTWVAAAVGANSAAGMQLATGEPVMPIGGFNGSDPSPTLEQFQAYVADGEIHYFVGSGGLGGMGGGMGRQNGGSDASSDIATWVAANFTATTVDGTTVYDLTAPTT